ncbi:MAG: XRE family transcriptional regulator [Myxococcota bacterium]
MARKFDELRRKMSPERQQRNEEAAARDLLEMNLQELRTKLARYSQQDLAELLEVTQGYISKLERQRDMPVSRLYAYVEALGGKVEIRAKLPDSEEVSINQFTDLAKLEAVLTPKRKNKEAG